MVNCREVITPGRHFLTMRATGAVHCIRSLPICTGVALRELDVMCRPRSRNVDAVTAGEESGRVYRNFRPDMVSG